jgi:RNA recognition motif-containing protein
LLQNRNGLEISVTIYVGNLSFQASEEDIRDVFAEYGKVSRVSLPTDRETGRKRGFAFVDMENDAEEDAAIAELDGAEWLGRELKVNKAKPREGGGGGRGNGMGR